MFNSWRHTAYVVSDTQLLWLGAGALFAWKAGAVQDKRCYPDAVNWSTYLHISLFSTPGLHSFMQLRFNILIFCTWMYRITELVAEGCLMFPLQWAMMNCVAPVLRLQLRCCSGWALLIRRSSLQPARGFFPLWESCSSTSRFAVQYFLITRSHGAFVESSLVFTLDYRKCTGRCNARS